MSHGSNRSKSGVKAEEREKRRQKRAFFVKNGLYDVEGGRPLRRVWLKMGLSIS